MAKTKRAALPVSRAKTAYGLLSEVKRLILAEPKRYDQRTFIARVGGIGGAYYIDEVDAPRCGTVGCVAGWVATLKRGNRFKYEETDTIASRVLGLSCTQAGELFTGGDSVGTPQTIAHAQFGARHITRFQQKYATQLKKKAV